MKKTFYTELAYLLGILALALGAALMARADFGLSMVVAPAYLLHLKISEALPFFSFGMAEYALQAVVLLLLAAILRKWKRAYLLSFATAVFYGFVLDGVMLLTGLFPCGTFALRIAFYLAGLLFCAVGVSLLFHTYLPPEAYELFVKELSAKLGVDIHKCKTVYDCVSCAVAVVLSFSFYGFGHFEGVKLGTVLCALVNGMLIGVCSRRLDARFVFRDGLPLRKFIEG